MLHVLSYDASQACRQAHSNANPWQVPCLEANVVPHLVETPALLTKATGLGLAGLLL